MVKSFVFHTNTGRTKEINFISNLLGSRNVGIQMVNGIFLGFDYCVYHIAYGDDAFHLIIGQNG